MFRQAQRMEEDYAEAFEAAGILIAYKLNLTPALPGRWKGELDYIVDFHGPRVWDLKTVGEGITHFGPIPYSSHELQVSCYDDHVLPLVAHALGNSDVAIEAEWIDESRFLGITELGAPALIYAGRFTGNEAPRYYIIEDQDRPDYKPEMKAIEEMLKEPIAPDILPPDVREMKRSNQLKLVARMQMECETCRFADHPDAVCEPWRPPKNKKGKHQQTVTVGSSDITGRWVFDKDWEHLEEMLRDAYPEGF